MTSNRFHIPFDPKFEDGMTRFKKQYRIRFFKKLDGGQPGWSVPVEYRDHIQDILQEPCSITRRDQATQCDLLSYSHPHPEGLEKKKRRYKNDVADEVRSFFNTFLQ